MDFCESALSETFSSRSPHIIAPKTNMHNNIIDISFCIFFLFGRKTTTFTFYGLCSQTIHLFKINVKTIHYLLCDIKKMSIVLIFKNGVTVTKQLKEIGIYQEQGE